HRLATAAVVDVVAAEIKVIDGGELVEEKLRGADELFGPRLDGDVGLGMVGVEVVRAGPDAAAGHRRILGVTAATGGRADDRVAGRNRRQPRRRCASGGSRRHPGGRQRDDEAASEDDRSNQPSTTCDERPHLSFLLRFYGMPTDAITCCW